MRRLFSITARFLHRSPLSEPIRRLKQRLKRHLERQADGAEYVTARPLFAFGPAALRECVRVASGATASLDCTVLPGDRPDCASRLDLSWSIRNLDYRANWLQLEWRPPDGGILDLRDCDAVALQLDSCGAGGQLLLTLTNESGDSFSINRPDILDRSGPQLALFPFCRGFRPPWKSGANARRLFSFRQIRCLELSIRPGDHPLPVQGRLRIDEMLALRKRNNIIALNPQVRDSRMVDDLRQGVEERLAVDCGPLSRMTLSLDADHPFQGRPSLKLFWQRRKTDPRRDWITLQAPLQGTTIASDLAGILLYLQPDGQGGVLRVTLRDRQGRERVLDESHILAWDEWRRLYLPLSLFAPPRWRGGDGSPLGELESLSLSLLPPPGQSGGELRIGGWFLAGRADFPHREGPEQPAPLRVEDRLIRCAEDPTSCPLPGNCGPELDDFGCVLVVPTRAGLTLDWELPGAPRRLPREASIGLRLERALVPPRMELITPAGDLFAANPGAVLPWGHDELILYPLENFRREEGGIRFTESARAQGLVRSLRLIVPARDAGLPLRLRQLLLLTGRSEGSSLPQSGADTPPSSPEVVCLQPAPLATARTKTPARSVSLDPRQLKARDDASGGEYGLSRIALFIEPTNLCNLRCIMCNHGDHSFRRGLGVMKFKDFRRITAEIREEKLKFWEFAPFWLGEPFIHPQIRDFLEEGNILKRDFSAMQHYNIHTNGVNLSEAHLRMIVDSELSSVLFSLDAASAETYAAIRRGGQWENTVASIERLLALRREAGRDKPAIIVQFIVMDENVHEIVPFRDFWRERGITRTIYAACPADNPFPDVDPDVDLLFPQTPVDAVFIKALEPNALTKSQKHREALAGDVCNPPWRFACASLFRMLSVAWDGEATACCRDDQIDMPIGNVLREGIVNVWYGEKLRELRLKHIQGDLSAVAKCASCVNWVKNPLETAELLHWLRSIGREDLAGPYLARVRKRT